MRYYWWSIRGCTPSYLEYNPDATVYDGSCQTFAVFGCMDNNYLEFNSNANVDDGTCINYSWGLY